MLGTVGLRLAGVRLLVGWHQSIADLVPVAEVVGLDQRGGQRVAAPVALAPLPVGEKRATVTSGAAICTIGETTA